MQRFEDVVRVVAKGVPGDDLESSLLQLGPVTQRGVDQLERGERAALADRFVRNLKSQSMYQATDLERALLQQLDAAPMGVWSSPLDTAVALVELRNHLKQALTLLGLDWNSLTRLQSLVGGVARWLQSIGGASVEVQSTPYSVDFVLCAKDRQLTPELVRESPMVQMLRTQLHRFDVSQQNATVEITFSIHRS